MMPRRAILTLVIALSFASVLYTTNGCGGVTSPETPHAGILGVVTNATSSAPIANAVVALRQNETSVSVPTDENGRYNVGGFAPGDLRVDVSATGYQPFSATVRLATGLNMYDVRLRPLN